MRPTSGGRGIPARAARRGPRLDAAPPQRPGSARVGPFVKWHRQRRRSFTYSSDRWGPVLSSASPSELAGEELCAPLTEGPVGALVLDHGDDQVAGGQAALLLESPRQLLIRRSLLLH